MSTNINEHAIHLHTLDDAIKERARKIKILVLDIDGVMTDGGLYYDHNGICMKRFNVLDGLGIRMAQEADIKIAVISGSDISVSVARLKYIGIKEYYGSVANKYQQLKAIIEPKNIQWDEVAYVGDDIVDLAVMSSVGLPVAVPNAIPEIKGIAQYITQKNGGHGAVRETIDLLIFCQDKKEKILHEWINLK